MKHLYWILVGVAILGLIMIPLPGPGLLIVSSAGAALVLTALVHLGMFLTGNGSRADD